MLLHYLPWLWLSLNIVQPDVEYFMVTLSAFIFAKRDIPDYRNRRITITSFIDQVFQTKNIADLKVSARSVISYFIVQPQRKENIILCIALLAGDWMSEQY